MKCPICKHGETTAGDATVTLERGSLTLVVKAEPAPAPRSMCATSRRRHCHERPRPKDEAAPCDAPQPVRRVRETATRFSRRAAAFQPRSGDRIKPGAAATVL